jgi:phage host-nuclease inhibitor protein Gam
MELQLKEFTLLNKADLSGKTKELAFGRLGFRMSTRLVLPKVADGVIAQLKKMGMADCVSVKEQVNKEILKTYEEKTILAVGASLEKKDTFWYETKQEQIAETP